MSERRGMVRQRVATAYAQIAPECAIVTASDSFHAPYLINFLASMQARFPDHPAVHVFDLGLSASQRSEIAAASRAQVRSIDHFVPHWRANWAWKPYIILQMPERYLLYLDAPNMVLYRSLATWFCAIRTRGYLLIENGQQMLDMTPPDYWQLAGLEAVSYANAQTFGAGVIGFDRFGPAGEAVAEVLRLTRLGWNLGRSPGETRRSYDASVVRQCPVFRADQTLFNLAFRKHFGQSLVLRPERKYLGLGAPADHPRQYLWYARRRPDSLGYFWRPLAGRNWRYFNNRIFGRVLIAARYHRMRALHWLQRVRG